VTPQEKLKLALGQIEGELEQRLAQFKKENKLLEAQRLEQRTRFDLEMLEETGFVKVLRIIHVILRTGNRVSNRPPCLTIFLMIICYLLTNPI